MDMKGRWALVTGASSGLGADFSELLAEKGCHLVVTARRADRLEELAAKLRAQYGIEVLVHATDLGDASACDDLFQATEASGLEIDVLINNAGFGTHAPFIDTDWDRTHSQLELNMVSLSRMCWLWGRRMSSRGRGHIMNVASINAYMPIPGYATYAATKAYVHHFTLAIAEELRPHGVHVSSLCPGPTATEFIDVAGHALAPWQRQFLMPSRKCAEIGINSMLAGSTSQIAGWSNKAMIAGLKLLPERAVTLLVGRLMR